MLVTTVQCLAENDCEWIGYVVSEALADVNEAISNNKLKPFFSGIKYIVYYKQSGWYAGISVIQEVKVGQELLCKAL